MFGLKNLFKKIIDASNNPYSYEMVSDTLHSIKLKSRFEDDSYFYNHDIFDERMVLYNDSLSHINTNPDKEYEIYQWIKKDGEYVNKGEVICLIRYVPHTNIHGYHRVAVLPPVISPEDGYLNIILQEDEEVFIGEEISQIKCSAQPIDFYPPNESMSSYYFNKYDIPDNIRTPRHIMSEYDISIKHHELDNIHLLDWLVDDNVFVNVGDAIAEVGAVYEGKPVYKYTLKSKVSGFINKILPSFHQEPIYQDSWICCFHKTEKDLHEFTYFNHHEVFEDDFTMNKTIKWNVIGGHVLPFGSKDATYNIGAVIVNSNNEQFQLMFSLEYVDSKDYIVFKYFNNQYKLSPNDEIQFMFDDNSIDKFQIIENSTKIRGAWKNLYETKIPITHNELDNLKNKEFIKWKIAFDNGTDFISGNNSNERVGGSLLSQIINEFATMYEAVVSTEVPNHQPLYERKSQEISTQTSQLCHVYLMLDTTNNYYKIGMSNKPEYREKTLQGDKPSIELLCSKEYPNKGIARSIEQALHSNFSSKRIRGEWFELDLMEVQNILDTLK